MRTLLPHELQALFPKLTPENYQRTSRATPRYNCVAFANDDERHWWEPGIYGGMYYWPPDVADDDLLEAWTRLFTRVGYQLTDNRDHEPGFEKIAIYLADGSPTHVAKSDGYVWMSKLGKGQDISHASLDVLEGNAQDEYGTVRRLLKRPMEPRRTI